MNRKLLIKLLLDITMFCLLIIAMIYPITGNLIHEIIGVLFILLIIIHNVLNWRWYKGITKGKYTLSRAIHMSINLLLLLFIFCLLFSTLLVSHILFEFIHLDWGITGRKIHLVAAYWGLIIISIHVGLHWNMLISIAKKYLFSDINSFYFLFILRFATVIIVVYGIYVFYQQEMISKLFLKSLYSFWNKDQSFIWIFLDYIAMSGLFVCISHYTFKYLRIYKF